MTNDDIAKGLRDAAYILLRAANEVDDVGVDRTSRIDIAELARQQADTAYREAIGATCEDCGGREAVKMY